MTAIAFECLDTMDTYSTEQGIKKMITVTDRTVTFCTNMAIIIMLWFNTFNVHNNRLLPGDRALHIAKVSELPWNVTF
jgi:hypothetical protein